MPSCQRCGVRLPDNRRKWCSANCCKRACDDRARRSCVDCGSPLHARSQWKNAPSDSTSERCQNCRRERNLERRLQRIERVAEMYRAGLTQRAIASTLGYGPNSTPPEIVEARRLGLIGYRNRGYEATK